MAQRYKVAMIGCDRDHPDGEGYTYADALEAHPRFMLVGAADVGEPLTDQHGASRGFPQVDHLLDDLKPDILALGRRCGLHLPTLEAAADSGVKGVLCETPNLTSQRDHQRIGQFIHDSGLKIIVPNVRRCLPAFRYAKSRYLDGTVGKPMLCIAAPKGDRHVDAFPWLDIVRFLHDDEEVAWVFGQARACDGGVSEPHAIAFFGFGSNAKALLDIGSELTGKDAIVLVGAKGSIRIRIGNLVIVEGTEKRKRNFSNDPDSQWTRCWYRIMASFVEWLDGDPEPELGHSNMLKTSELSLAMHLSATRADRIDLPLDSLVSAASAELSPSSKQRFPD